MLICELLLTDDAAHVALMLRPGPAEPGPTCRLLGASAQRLPGGDVLVRLGEPAAVLHAAGLPRALARARERAAALAAAGARLLYDGTARVEAEGASLSAYYMPGEPGRVELRLPRSGLGPAAGAAVVIEPGEVVLVSARTAAALRALAAALAAAWLLATAGA